MKKENAKNVRPPSFQPQKGRKRETDAASQNAGAAPNEAANTAARPAAREPTPAPGASRHLERQVNRVRRPRQRDLRSTNEHSHSATIAAKLQFRGSPPGPTRAAPVAPEATQPRRMRRRAEQAQEITCVRNAPTSSAGSPKAAKRAEQVQQSQQAERARRARRHFGLNRFLSLERSAAVRSRPANPCKIQQRSRLSGNQQTSPQKRKQSGQTKKENQSTRTRRPNLRKSPTRRSSGSLEKSRGRLSLRSK